MEHQNLIAQQIVEAQFSSEETARLRQDELATIFREIVPKVIDKVFSELSHPDEIIQLNRLEIDLGAIKLHELASEIEYRLRQHLQDKTERAIAEVKMFPAAENKVVSLRYKQENVILTYLKTGLLDWRVVINSNKGYSTLEKLILSLSAKERDDVLAKLGAENRAKRIEISKRLVAVFQNDLSNVWSFIGGGKKENVLKSVFEVFTKLFKEASPDALNRKKLEIKTVEFLVTSRLGQAGGVQDLVETVLTSLLEMPSSRTLLAPLQEHNHRKELFKKLEEEIVKRVSTSSQEDASDPLLKKEVKLKPPLDLEQLYQDILQLSKQPSIQELFQAEIVQLLKSDADFEQFLALAPEVISSYINILRTTRIDIGQAIDSIQSQLGFAVAPSVRTELVKALAARLVKLTEQPTQLLVEAMVVEEFVQQMFVADTSVLVDRYPALFDVLDEKDQIDFFNLLTEKSSSVEITLARSSISSIHATVAALLSPVMKDDEVQLLAESLLYEEAVSMLKKLLTPGSEKLAKLQATWSKLPVAVQNYRKKLLTESVGDVMAPIWQEQDKHGKEGGKVSELKSEKTLFGKVQELLKSPVANKENVLKLVRPLAQSRTLPDKKVAVAFIEQLSLTELNVLIAVAPQETAQLFMHFLETKGEAIDKLPITFVTKLLKHPFVEEIRALKKALGSTAGYKDLKGKEEKSSSIEYKDDYPKGNKPKLSSDSKKDETTQATGKSLESDKDSSERGQSTEKEAISDKSAIKNKPTSTEEKGAEGPEATIRIVEELEESLDDYADIIRQVVEEEIALRRKPDEGTPYNFPEVEENTPMYIDTAGIVLLNSYIPMLFERLGLTVTKKFFVSQESREKGVLLLHYLCMGNVPIEEHHLVFLKLLCGLDMFKPLDPAVIITDEEKELCEGLLQAVIDHWKALKKTSPENLRASFLIREGSLMLREGVWELKVEKKTIDILIERIPWSFSMIKYAWMDKAVVVTWV